MIFKTVEDFERVALAGKPENVIKTFATSHLVGKALQDQYRSLLDDDSTFSESGFQAWLEMQRRNENWEMPVISDDALDAFLRQNYAILREGAYGPWKKQMDMQYDGTWEAHVAAVKERWPKP